MTRNRQINQAAAPDDGPEPVRMTPRRMADELDAIALASSKLRLRVRSLTVYLAAEKGETRPNRDNVAILANLLASAADQATDVGMRIRVGEIPLAPDYLQPDHTPERPLLDAIEARPMLRVAAAIASTVAARGDTDPGWPSAEAHPVSSNGTIAGNQWTDAHTRQLAAALDAAEAPPAPKPRMRKGAKA
jgi:hypothetical protein